MSKIYLVKNNDKLTTEDKNEDDIYMVTQFFIHGNNERYNEIKFCLQRNIDIGLFKKIILLNERIYTSEELGLTEDQMKCIQQVNIKHRMRYNSVLLRIKMSKISGYIVFCNSDIFRCKLYFFFQVTIKFFCFRIKSNIFFCHFFKFFSLQKDQFRIKKRDNPYKPEKENS